MSKKAIISTIVVCLLLGLVGASILGWMYISRDRVAVASYRVVVPEGELMENMIAKEAELMKSDEVLRPVVEVLELQTRWKLGSEEEALTRLRSKLKVKPGTVADRVKVIYRDRSQKRALEILAAINREFAEARFEATRDGTMPPMAPTEQPVDPDLGSGLEP